MKIWRISLLSLLLVATAIAVKGDDGLDIDQDQTDGVLIHDDSEQGNNEMSWQTAEEIVDAIREFGNVTRLPVAIYRDDLPSDYVAYWLVEFGASQYIVISSGSKTGDYLVSSQGPLPSPITELDSTAQTYGKECAKYLMMTPGGEMMCRDKMGKIVATTAEELLLPGNKTDDDPHFEHAHEYIDTHMTVLEEQWRARADEVNRQSIWTENKVELSTETNEVSRFTEDYVKPGGMVRVPVDMNTVSVKVKYQPEDETQTAEEVAQAQKAMCQMISSCDVNDDCSIDLSQKRSVLHLTYIELEISKEIAAAFKGRQSVEFELRVEQASGAVIVRHYSLDTTRHRQKRFKEYKSWGSWTTRSIPDEGYFPNYWQHKIKKGCAVGCGPVAWAMVFGYYDRRSHYKTSKYGSGSQDLYRYGYDGTTGSKSCVAPEKSGSTRLRRYIEKIAKTLGTWCIFKNGATPAYKMDNIKGFFQARQKSGSPTVKQTNNIWRLFSRESIARTTRTWVKSGRPVVVGTTEGGFFKWHYPVATKVRNRSRKYRRCVKIIWKICGKWHSGRQYQMYTHQGWSGTKTKWRSMSLHYAAIATY